MYLFVSAVVVKSLSRTSGYALIMCVFVGSDACTATSVESASPGQVRKS